MLIIIPLLAVFQIVECGEVVHSLAHFPELGLVALYRESFIKLRNHFSHLRMFMRELNCLILNILQRRHHLFIEAFEIFVNCKPFEFLPYFGYFSLISFFTQPECQVLLARLRVL